MNTQRRNSAPPANEDAYSALFGMEIPLLKAHAFTQALVQLSTGINAIEPNVVNAISSALEEHMDFIMLEWKNAFNSLREGKPR